MQITIDVFTMPYNHTKGEYGDVLFMQHRGEKARDVSLPYRFWQTARREWRNRVGETGRLLFRRHRSMAHAGKHSLDIDGFDGNDPFGQLDERFRLFLAHLAKTMKIYVERSQSGEFEVREDEARRHFSLLVRHAVEHAMTPQIVASKLGVTVSTVHRWAKGEFVPSQRYIRTAAIRDIETIISELLEPRDPGNPGSTLLNIDEFVPPRKAR